ncbi:MAG: M23 family metallopeptidase [Oscillibacter sp.]|nr:M23 family metallopeptidase [Oscillibacter sp.]
MEKRKAGNAPFYAAMAVCLLAAGVGTWQLLRPPKGREAVSASAPVTSLPAQTTPLLPSASQDSVSAWADGGAALDSGNSAPPSEEERSVPASAPAAVPQTEEKTPSDTLADGGTKTPDRGETVSGGDSTPGSSSDSDARSGKSRTVCSPLSGETAAAFSMDRLQYNQTLGDWRTHDGLDITAELGTAVSAACDGTVAAVTEDPLMGVTVVLRHDGGYETTYAGLQEASREVGDEVPAGAMLGTVGDTAAAEAYQGPHLHFSVRHGGVPMDPEEFLSGA